MESICARIDHNRTETPSNPSLKNGFSFILMEEQWRISSLLILLKTVFVNFLLIVKHFQVHRILFLTLFWQFQSLESLSKYVHCSGGDDRPNWVPCRTCSWLRPNCYSGIKQTFGRSAFLSCLVFQCSYNSWVTDVFV